MEVTAGIAVQAWPLQLDLQLEGLVPADCKSVVEEEVHRKNSVADSKHQYGWVWGELREAVGIAGLLGRPPLSGILLAGWTYSTRDDSLMWTGLSRLTLLG